MLVDGTPVPTGNRAGSGPTNFNAKHKKQTLGVQVAAFRDGTLADTAYVKHTRLAPRKKTTGVPRSPRTRHRTGTSPASGDRPDARSPCSNSGRSSRLASCDVQGGCSVG